MRSRYDDPTSRCAAKPLPRFGGPTMTLRSRLMRLSWMCVWKFFASWTPPHFRRWRNMLLRSFGAEIHATAMVHSKAIVWWPGHLSMERYASLGPATICYNVDRITICEFASVSQRAHLCTGSHDIQDSGFPLTTRPIVIEANAWIAAEAFVGPGVVVGEGAVLGARGVTAKPLLPWTVYVGNPAKAVGSRSPQSAAVYALNDAD
ncbi:acetyltransferase [Pseudorhizobium endolithicum]|uniref:Acetyltransferase n=1 Tax=Pseudorhizobium endolithicum TaxID=1191678 RepID=A0ABN7JRF4_9HYPH|nr:acetyltransferase [Pseudorhizobium endolithicum]